MTFDFQTALLFAVFLVFVVLAYKTVKLVTKVAMVGIVAALFPVAAKFMGLPVELTIQSIAFFAFTGMLLYVLFTFSKLAMSAVEIAAKAVAWPFRQLLKKSDKRQRNAQRSPKSQSGKKTGKDEDEKEGEQ